jgi:hypothetical protein
LLKVDATIRTDERVDNYLLLHPLQFSRLSRMELRQLDDTQELVLELKHEAKPSQVRLTFQGVTGLEFQPHVFQPVLLYCRSYGSVGINGKV